jgi:hypothetical protein
LVPFNFINTYGEVSYPAHPDVYKFANFEQFSVVLAACLDTDKNMLEE